MINRRTFMQTTVLVAGGVLLPTLAFANSCKSAPGTVDNIFKRIDQLAPQMVTTNARLNFDRTFVDFEYVYLTAINGQTGEQAYFERNDAEREALIQKVFAESARLQTTLVSLRQAFQNAGVAGIPRDLMALQVEAFEGDYENRRRQIPQSVALMDDPLVGQDDILASAAKDLKLAIQTVGGGNTERAIALAWAASPHSDRNHFRQFLPMVSPSDALAYRMAQLKRGAEVLRV